MEPTRTQSLLDAAANGSRSAQDEVVRQFAPAVRSRVHNWLERDFRKTHGWMLAAFSTGDVVQDVFVDVIRGIERIEFRGVDKVTGYLATVAYRRILRLVNHHTRDCRNVAEKVEGDLLDEEENARELDPAFAASLVEQMSIFRGAFLDLSDRQQLLIERRLVDQIAFAQIAVELGYASADSARMAYYDVRAHLVLKLRAKGIGTSSQK